MLNETVQDFEQIQRVILLPESKTIVASMKDNKMQYIYQLKQVVH